VESKSHPLKYKVNLNSIPEGGSYLIQSSCPYRQAANHLKHKTGLTNKVSDYTSLKRMRFQNKRYCSSKLYTHTHIHIYMYVCIYIYNTYAQET
jgi:hypothetical protein